MAPYIAPALWFMAGLLPALGWTRLTSERVLERRTPEQLQQLRVTFDSRVHIILTGSLGLLCLLATIRSIWTDRGIWWMWLLATVAQFGALAARERAAARFFWYVGEPRGPRSELESTRQRHVMAYAGVGMLALVAGEVVMPAPGTEEPGSATSLVGLVLFIVGALAALAAGWSAVWVFKARGDRPGDATEPRPDQPR